MATITERIDATTRIPPRFLRADPPVPRSVKIEISIMGAVIQAVISAAAALAMLAGAADAAGQQQTRQREQERTQERAGKREIIPGSELMTSREREDYRRRYAAAKTEGGKDKVRADHVKAMQERARVRGLQLAPPVKPAGDEK